MCSVCGVCVWCVCGVCVQHYLFTYTGTKYYNDQPGQQPTKRWQLLKKQYEGGGGASI